MTIADMHRVVETFAAAARRAAGAGFDLAVVDMAGGYLLGGFVSPLTNLRRDPYGGDLDARLRHPLEVLAAVREVWPADRPLAVRIAATDWHPRGTTPEEAVEAARQLRQLGVALLDVTGGGTVADAAPDYRRLYLLPLVDRIRNEARIPTLGRGGITTFDLVDTIVAAGRADLCLLDPQLYRGAGR